MKKLRFPLIAFAVLVAVAMTSIPAAEAAARAPCRNEKCVADPITFKWECAGGGSQNCTNTILGLFCNLSDC